MTIMKILRVILILILALCLTGGFLLYTLLIILWKPRTRIAEFLNIIRRKPLSRAGKPPPANWNDPTLGEHGFLHVNDIKLHYVASGEEGKPLMLFVHGFFGCWYSWRYQIREFQKNYRVVALDLRGFSLSDCPRGKSNYVLTKQAADIAAVIDALGYKDCILVCRDWGVQIAYETVTNYPDKISKTIAFNYAAGPAWKDHFGDNLSQAKFVFPFLLTRIPYVTEFLLTFGDLVAFEGILWSKEGIKKENLTEEDLEVFKYAFSQEGVIYSVIDSYCCVFSTKAFKPMNDWDILVINGSDNEYVPKAVIDDSSKYFPNGVFRNVKGGQQYVNQNQPEIVNEFMNEYLNKVSDKE